MPVHDGDLLLFVSKGADGQIQCLDLDDGWFIWCCLKQHTKFD